MSQSGAVYQPTTVTYEANTSPQEERWPDRSISYLSTLTRTPGHPCGLTYQSLRNALPTILLCSSTICLAIGLVMLINGGVGYAGAQKDKDSFYLICTLFGALFFAGGVLLLGFFLRQSRRLCCRTGKDPLDPATGQSLTVNPSTDLLVAAQYAPVSEVAYRSPAEDSEQSKLMPQETKDTDDTDRMIERDPRIVLRPLNPPTHEET